MTKQKFALMAKLSVIFTLKCLFASYPVRNCWSKDNIRTCIKIKYYSNFHIAILQRDRKERKHYIDDWALGDPDDEIEGPQSFDLDEKLRSPRFDKNLVKEMIGTGKK